MRISHRFVGALTVLDLAGSLTVGPDERELVPLRTTIADLVHVGCIDLVVNLSELTSIDARGLGELATAMKMVRNAGGRLTLMAASPRVARMLAITRLNTIFAWRDAEAELYA